MPFITGRTPPAKLSAPVRALLARRLNAITKEFRGRMNDLPQSVSENASAEDISDITKKYKREAAYFRSNCRKLVCTVHTLGLIPSDEK